MGNGFFALRSNGAIALNFDQLAIAPVSSLSYFLVPISSFRSLRHTIAIGLTILPVAPMNLSGVQTNVEIHAPASDSAFR